MSQRRPRILLAEDDANLRIALADNLEAEGYEVFAVESGDRALTVIEETELDLAILDIMLPGLDGYALSRELRARAGDTKVLMLTARTLEDDLLKGFEAGADDYLTKPYRLKELLARVRALLRRGSNGRDDRRLRFGDFDLDLDARTLKTASGEEVGLTKTEFDLLAFLLTHAGEVLSRNRILDAVWGEGVIVDERTVDNFVSSLKKKLGWTPADSFCIHTVRGVGYRMEVPLHRGG